MRKKLATSALALAMCAVTTMPVMAATSYTNSTASVDETQTFTADTQTSVKDENATNVYATVGSTFNVTIPKTIILAGDTKTGSYSVSATGDIAGDEFVSVVPESSFKMSQSGKANVEATVTQTITKFRGDNFTGALTTGEAKMATGATGTISATGLTAGSWNGNFNFAIKLNQDVAN